MDLSSVTKLIVSILASFAAGGIGSLFTIKAIPTWYARLKKPPYTPPNWVFGPVWTTLYILMSISIFLVWQKGFGNHDALPAFVLFWIQLAVNAIWSIIFFGMKSIFGGVVTIIVLWLLILVTMVTSFRVSAWSGALLIPYIVWVSIASYLNIGVWMLNKTTEQRKAV